MCEWAFTVALARMCKQSLTPAVTVGCEWALTGTLALMCEQSLTVVVTAGCEWALTVAVHWLLCVNSPLQ